MSRSKAVLLFDPARRTEQLAYVRERATIMHVAGDQAWVELTDDQAQRFAAQGIGVQPRPDADLITVPALVFDPLVEVPTPAPALTAAMPDGPLTSLTIVQFIAPADPDWLAEIAEIGGHLIQNIPVNAALYRLTASQMAEIAALNVVRWVGLYHPAYAIGHLFAAPGVAWTAATLAQQAVDPNQLPPAGQGNIVVRTSDDVLPSSLRSRIQAAGATVLQEIDAGLLVDGDAAAIPRIAAVPGVLAIEPFYALEVANNRAGIISGIEQVRQTGAVNFLVNLDGAGEIVAVIDSGLDTGALPLAHADFAGRVLQINNLAVPGTPAPDPAAGTGQHGTHVTGTIAGGGAGSAGRVRGVAPACSIIFQGPFNANYLQAFGVAHDAGARVHNNSWGTTDRVTNNVYLGGQTDLIDQFCFTHPDSLILFAVHNHERDIVPAPGGDGVLDRNRLTFQATAKNVLAVGASESARNNDGWANDYRAFFGARYNHAGLTPLAAGAAGAFVMSDNANHVALFSNRGIVNSVNVAGVMAPTGRVRPDLVAPGTNILSTRSSTVPVAAAQAWQNPVSEAAAQYIIMHGTSMATPHVAGAAILTRQYYRTRFGQLRRPLALDDVALPAAPPQPTFIDRPALASHADGLVVAWLRPALPADVKSIRATRLRRDLTTLTNTPVVLQTAVGVSPAPMLAQHGEQTLLLHRHADATIRLSRYQRDLTPAVAFGTNGVVTVAPSRLDDSRPPCLLVVGDEVAVAWADAATTNLLFRRYSATTGAAIDPAPVVVGPMLHTGPHPFISHNGVAYLLAWVNQVGANVQLNVRRIDQNGAPIGAQPQTILQQAQAIRDPQIIWDARQGRFVLVWCDSRVQPGGQIHLRLLDATGAPVGVEVVAIRAPMIRTVRRPRLGLHPDAGLSLVWEDNSQNGSHDVYMTLLDGQGQADGRIAADAQDPFARSLVRLSDTPNDTGGLATLTDDQGPVTTWQTTDEVNSDRRGLVIVAMTRQGAFQAQVDPAVPLINSGRYVPHTLIEHTRQSQTSTAIAWCGGEYALVRSVQGTITTDLQLVRTNADGQPDPAYGVNGARALHSNIGHDQVEIYWTGDRTIVASVSLFEDPVIGLFDVNGAPWPTFGTNGVRVIRDPGLVHSAVSPQLGHYTRPAFRAVMVYGTGFGAGINDQIRYVVLNEQGQFVTAPRNLAVGSGTARHGWFHFVHAERRSIAVWERVEGGRLTIRGNRYSPEGGAQHRVDIVLTALPGESRNAVVEPRPVGLTSLNREYGLAWQYRPDAATAWEIRFSRLDRDGRPLAAPPAPAVGAPPPPTPVSDIRVIFPGVAGWPAGLQAIEPQLVSTYTHEAWANAPSPVPAGTALPAWSPGYGLAWLGEAADGRRTLYFTALDENGVRANLPQPPPNPPAAAPLTVVSRAGVDVREFKLIWNGRTFRLVWTEIEGGVIRQVQTALTRYGSQAAFDQPSAALVRSTLINGATNLQRVQLPDVANGYGWGRLNLRQALAPSLPVTFHVRDDNALGSGRTARYRFNLPPNTALLRATLGWIDPPGATVVNRLHLRITAPAAPPAAAQVYQGNSWQAPPNDRMSQAIAPPPAPATPFQTTHPIEQVVIENPPPGTYLVEVIAEVFPANTLNQFNAQAFALVFVGSGPEIRFGGLPAAGIPVY